MKLTFTFTKTANLSELSKYDIYQTHFQLPDAAIQLPDLESQLLNIASTVGELTQACLYFTCRDIRLVNRLVKTSESSAIARNTRDVTAIAFARYKYAHRQRESRLLSILYPIEPPIRLGITIKVKRLVDACIKVGHWKFPPAYDDYLRKINSIRDNLLILLNSETPPEYITDWKYLGFVPRWVDNALITERNKRRRAIEREHKQQEREPEKVNEKNKPKKGHIYFIQQGENGAIKIGYSTKPEKRLRTLRTASPYPLQMRLVIEGGKKLEKELHDKFADCQLDGEWFEATTALLSFIEEQHQG